MKALIQRVSSASVTVGGEVVGAIESGLLVLLGVAEGDSEADVSYLTDKLCNLRIFPNDEGKFDFSLVDIKGSVLLVSQFTLLADCSKGRRPNFQKAAKPDEAKRLYELMEKEIVKLGLRCATGQFQAHMDVRLCNDGPVTLLLESK
ncbi:MAG: D-tyrosyl-tRNA(Tyr) deacylase [Proteobacteria bacterium]|nr:MAG: D-tyrosyl-tRNA(Tyr) deacylase [Pseudomonadota bacterium]